MANDGTQAAFPSVRWPWLDGLRGIAIIGMAVYHFTWDLTFFHFAPASVLRSPGFVLFGHTIACSFLAIAGFALAIAARPQLDVRKFAWRLGKIVAAALLVTLATYIAFPDAFVSFGILHCIAAASVLSLAFVRAPYWLTALAGVAIFLAGSLIETPRFDVVNGWIGLGQRIPLTNDWRPLFPWSGAMLLGLACGQYALPRDLCSRSVKPPPRWLSFAGRHSLLIYLVHQPLLFALVFLTAQALGTRMAGSVPPQPFISACTDRCTNANGAPDACLRACTCIPAEANKAGIWNIIATGARDDNAQAKYDEIVAMCRRGDRAR